MINSDYTGIRYSYYNKPSSKDKKVIINETKNEYIYSNNNPKAYAYNSLLTSYK